MEGKKNMGVKKSIRTLNRINKNKNKNKNRIKINFGKIIPSIVDYLKSDSYFYSPFIVSSSPPSDFAALFSSSKDKPILENQDSVKEKLVEYLKCDTYLYSPLVATQHRGDLAMKSAFSLPRGQELQFMRVTSTGFSKKIAWQTKKVTENAVVEKHVDHISEGVPHDASFISPQTPALEEEKKQATRRSSRLSTHSQVPYIVDKQ